MTILSNNCSRKRQRTGRTPGPGPSLEHRLGREASWSPASPLPLCHWRRHFKSVCARKTDAPQLAITLAVLTVFSGPCCRAQSAATNFFKYEAPTNLTGTIYTADRKKVMFKFSRRSVRHGDRLDVDRVFSYPDGTSASKEKVIYQRDELLEYDVDDLQLGARGSATIVSLKSEPARQIISLEYTKDVHSKTKPKTGTETLQKN